MDRAEHLGSLRRGVPEPQVRQAGATVRETVCGNRRREINPSNLDANDYVTSFPSGVTAVNCTISNNAYECCNWAVTR